MKKFQFEARKGNGFFLYFLGLYMALFYRAFAKAWTLQVRVGSHEVLWDISWEKQLMRTDLITAGRAINGGYSKFTAFRKLFVAERRDWTKPSAPRVGWKRGELAEVFLALLGGGNFREEWGDIGYYLAQSYDWAWLLYSLVTPKSIIAAAVSKFEQRAAKR